MDEEPIKYEILSDKITPTDIQLTFNELWSELLRSGSVVQREAEGIGILPDSIPDDSSQLISITPSAAGFETSLLDLVVAFVGSHGAHRIGHDLWVYVLLPRIRAKYGDLALRERNRKQGANK